MKACLLPVVAILALAACDSRDTADDTDAVVVVDEGGSAPPASPVPTATVTAAPAPTAAPAVGTIPAAIQGRWGLVPADCTSTRGDAKGLLRIDASTLRFYESVGTLAAIDEASATRIRGAFEFTGEGMEWQRDMVLDVQDGGDALVRTEYGDGAAPGPFRYTKCA